MMCYIIDVKGEALLYLWLHLAEEVREPSQFVVEHRKMRLYCLYGDSSKSGSQKALYVYI